MPACHLRHDRARRKWLSFGYPSGLADARKAISARRSEGPRRGTVQPTVTSPFGIACFLRLKPFPLPCSRCFNPLRLHCLLRLKSIRPYLYLRSFRLLTTHSEPREQGEDANNCRSTEFLL